MAVAIAKLAELDAELAALPGRDCGACGAPTCAALAEDIVMGRAHARLLSVRDDRGGERVMKLDEIARELGLTELTPPAADGDVDVTRGYASDLLSDVLAHAPSGGVLVTLQVHLNVIAVASHADLAAVDLRRRPAPRGRRARQGGRRGPLPLRSPDDTFDIVGRLYAIGVKGTDA